MGKVWKKHSLLRKIAAEKEVVATVPEPEPEEIKSVKLETPVVAEPEPAVLPKAKPQAAVLPKSAPKAKAKPKKARTKSTKSK